MMSIVISSISATEEEKMKRARLGRRYYLKRRNWIGRRIATLSNLFFKIAGVPLHYRTNAHSWQRYETTCFKRLHPKFAVFPIGGQGVCEECLPGENLWDHAMRGTLSRRMIRAAARELRRAHGQFSAYFDGPWSHGDASFSNVIYNPAEDR